MQRFLFVLSRGQEDPTRATRIFQFAKFAMEDGNPVTVFLVDDAVCFAKIGMADNVKAPTGDEMKPYLDSLIENNVPILVCTPCANARHLSEDEFIPNAKLGTGKMLIELMKESKVLSF